MFTGIIEQVGTIAGVENLGGGRRFTIEAAMAADLRPDLSVAVNGACQTVVANDATSFEVIAVEETLRKTTLGSFEPGMPVNLERPLQHNGRLDGHFVQGHVDATGELLSIEPEANSWLVQVAFPDGYAPYLIPVGSITIDGISLTVARLESDRLTVAIIPHTYDNTNVNTWRPGKKVNLEFDMIGKYVVRWMEVKAPSI